MGGVPEKSDAGFFLPVASRQGILFKAGVNLGGTTRVPSRPNGRRGLLISPETLKVSSVKYGLVIEWSPANPNAVKQNL